MAGPVLRAAAEVAARSRAGSGAGVRRAKALLGQTASQATGADIPRPRPTAETLPSPAAAAGFVVDAAYPVDNARILELMDRVNAEGMDSLAPDELILLEDLQSGKAYLSGSTQSAPLDAPQIDIAAPSADDLNGNLAASAIELDEAPKKGGAANLTPKKAKGPTKLEKIANEINQIAGSARTGEAIAPRQARSTWSKIDKLSSDEFAELVGVMGNEDAALAKLEQVQNVAGDAARDPNSLAAAAIDRAKQGRDGTMRAPGSNAPEFATDTLTDADMPTQADTAMAAARERQEGLEDLRAFDGLPLEERLRREGIDPSSKQASRKLPLYLKGRDRPKSLEGRSEGDRASNLSPADKGNLAQAEELKAAVDQAQAELRAAQYELRLAQMSRTSGRGAATDADIAAMRDNLANAQETVRRLMDMEDRLFPPRLVRDSDGQPLLDDNGNPRRVPAAMLKDPAIVPRGVRIDRGVRAKPDSVLQRAGQAETYDELIITAAGFRPKPQRNLNRSSASLSAAENRALADEAVEAFGEDAIEFLPEEQEVLDVIDDASAGKPRKVRGRPLPSRQRDALLRIFNGRNPIAVMGSPEAAVDEALSKNRQFRPGTANYEMVRESLVRSVREEFGGPGPQPATDAPAVSSRVQDPGIAASTPIALPAPKRLGLPGPATASDINLESSAVEIVPVEGSVDAKPKRGGGKGRKDPVVVDAEAVAPVEGRLSRDEIEAQATMAEQEAFQQAVDSGMSTKEARKAANARRKQVQKELLDANRVAPVEGSVDGKPAAAAETPKDTSPSPDRATVIDSEPLPTADGGGGKKPPSDPPGGKPRDGDADGTPPKKGDAKRGWGRYVWPAAGIAGLVATLNAIGRSSGGGTINIPTPPGGADGGGGGVSDPPFPPGAQVAGASSAPELRANDIDRALELIRSSRGGSSRATQTLQNW